MSHSDPWSAPPDVVGLDATEVHLWLLHGENAMPHLPALRACLSGEELARAARFYFEKDRERFTIGRAVLRRILAQYLNVPPAEIAFAYTDRGKPLLSGPAADTRLQFNASHTDAIFLYAVARERNVGVDIERVRPLERLDSLAARLLSPPELHRLQQLPQQQQSAEFLKNWTRREAVLKARGDGLGGPFSQFECHELPGSEQVAFTIVGEPLESERWYLLTFAPCDNCVASLAVEGIPSTVRKWQYQQEAPSE